MEVTLDIGKHVFKHINDIALNENVDFDIVALKILDLGLRIYQSSLEEKEADEMDPLLRVILNKTMENNYFLKETLGHVFKKERSMLKTYDEMTAIAVVEHMAKSFVDGKKSQI